MKTTEEMIKVMQAFVAEKEIEFNYLREDSAVWETTSSPAWAWNMFDYRVKQNWYDNIPDGGVLCYVRDNDSVDYCKFPVLIVAYDATRSNRWYISVSCTCWDIAKPLTKEEISKLLENAPE